MYFPDASNLTNYQSLISYVNNVTTYVEPSSGVGTAFFGVSILIMVFFITLLSLKMYSMEQAVVTASVLTMITAMLLSAIGLVNPMVVFMLVFVTVGSILLLYKNGE